MPRAAFATPAPVARSRAAASSSPSSSGKSGRHAPRAAASAAPPPPRRSSAAKIATVSDSQLADLASSGRIVVLKCFAKYCAGCRGVEPKFRKIAAAYADTTESEVSFCQMDFERYEAFCKEQLGVHSLPFFGIWKDGKYVGGEAMGWQSVGKKLVAKIESALGVADELVAGRERR